MGLFGCFYPRVSPQGGSDEKDVVAPSRVNSLSKGSTAVSNSNVKLSQMISEFVYSCNGNSSVEGIMYQACGVLLDHMAIDWCSVAVCSAGRQFMQVMESVSTVSLQGVDLGINRSGVLEVASLESNSVYYQLFNPGSNNSMPDYITFPDGRAGGQSKPQDEWSVLMKECNLARFIALPLLHHGKPSGSLVLGTCQADMSADELLQKATIAVGLLELSGLHHSLHETLTMVEMMHSPNQTVDKLLSMVLEMLPAFLQKSGGIQVHCQLAIMQNSQKVVFFNSNLDAEEETPATVPNKSITTRSPSLRKLPSPASAAVRQPSTNVRSRIQQSMSQSLLQRLPSLPSRQPNLTVTPEPPLIEGRSSIRVHTGRLQGSLLSEVLRDVHAWAISNATAMVNTYPSAHTELLHTLQRPGHVLVMPLLNKNGKKYGALYLFCNQRTSPSFQECVQQLATILCVHLHQVLLKMNLRGWLEKMEVLNQGMSVLAGAVATTVEVDAPERGDASKGSNSTSTHSLGAALAAGTPSTEPHSVNWDLSDIEPRETELRSSPSARKRKVSRSRSLFQVYSEVVKQRLEELGKEPFCHLEDIELKELVGQGGFGKVFKGRTAGRDIAVKVMKYRPDIDPKFLGRTAVEIATMANLDHPNIVKVLSHFEDVQYHEKIDEKTGIASCTFHQPGGETPPPGSTLAAIIVMEFCSMGNLLDAIQSRRYMRKSATGKSRPDMLLIVHTLQEIASAINYLHGLGIIHCDLKPQNILLTAAQNEAGFKSQLTDFGLAYILLDDHCIHGDSAGTPTHLAPEIFEVGSVKGFKNASADIYALGIIMWELYHGHAAYHDVRKRGDIARMVLDGERPQWSQSAPTWFRELAQRCYAQEPERRPPAQELLLGLTSNLEDVEARDSLFD